MNAVPIKRCHVFILIFIALLYNITNFVATKIQGKPIYPQMKWRGAKDLTFPLVIVIIAILLFFAIEWIERKKLKYNGHLEAVSILEGQNEI